MMILLATNAAISVSSRRRVAVPRVGGKGVSSLGPDGVNSSGVIIIIIIIMIIIIIIISDEN